MTQQNWPWSTSNVRPPDWRHRAAVERSVSTAADASADEADGSDMLVHLATRFYRTLRAANSRAARRQCAARMPVMGAVHDLAFTGPGWLDHVPPERRKYYEGPVEPNAQEWAALARGEPVPTLEAKIEMSAQARHERESRPVPSPGT